MHWKNFVTGSLSEFKFQLSSNSLGKPLETQVKLNTNKKLFLFKNNRIRFLFTLWQYFKQYIARAVMF